MTTVAKEKQNVQANWPVERMQKEFTKMIAGKIISRLKLVESGHQNAVDKFAEISAKQVAEMLKLNGVKTPLDLVKYMAEHQANLFGAKVQYAGDEKSATLFNENPTVWLEAKRIANLTPQQEELMRKEYENWKRNLAESLGFKAEVEIDKSGSQVTFRKP